MAKEAMQAVSRAEQAALETVQQAKEEADRLRREAAAQGEQLVYDTFFSNGQAVSKEEYDTAQAKQEEKPLAQWLAFTPENLEAAFPAPAS